MSDQGQPGTEFEDYSFTEEIATFGDRVVAARDAMGMTQSQLARRLGIQLKTLRNWEEDRSEPRANKLQMLAGMLNVSIIWLMSGQGQGVSEQSFELSNDDQDMISEIREVRALHLRMGERLARLEKKLRARS